MIQQSDTICALSTPVGAGAIGVIRLSGDFAMQAVTSIFKGKALDKQPTQSLHFGRIIDGEEVLDEVLLSLFKAPHSYTGEDVVEISAHGSPFILKSILSLLLVQGVRLAAPGEFTQRAYLNGKMDLAQAEAVGDLIASESKAAHDIAMQQMRGGFSKKINELRQELIQFTALIELELDFGEEDVEFADRDDLKALVDKILRILHELLSSFSRGNVMKNGLPVAIVGKPNVGKSTLLNALLNEDKAIVSDIAGTTRDSIEDTVNIGGMAFRFIDTAGIRETKDVVENIGIERTFRAVEKSSLVIYLVDATQEVLNEAMLEFESLKQRYSNDQRQFLMVVNKMDLVKDRSIENLTDGQFKISALNKDSMLRLLDKLETIAADMQMGSQDIIISSLRHHQALQQSANALKRVKEGLENKITGDFLAMDIRQALHYLGEITGSIEIDRDILGTIFSQFCIGK
ncbi:MAG: tRNA uridine-5-carboxymethylaminomethyl(34) synthesis GTPase MnmE [Verrucomicrobia bacterium]|nr:tRNA uridine-5-carboxymethylaminomethyl(34) synthesis GTPase MnmE [Verrucomicrobiota bacterium]